MVILGMISVLKRMCCCGQSYLSPPPQPYFSKSTGHVTEWMKQYVTQMQRGREVAGLSDASDQLLAAEMKLAEVSMLMKHDCNNEEKM